MSGSQESSIGQFGRGQFSSGVNVSPDGTVSADRVHFNVPTQTTSFGKGPVFLSASARGTETDLHIGGPVYATFGTDGAIGGGFDIGLTGFQRLHMPDGSMLETGHVLGGGVHERLYVPIEDETHTIATRDGLVEHTPMAAWDAHHFPKGTELVERPGAESLYTGEKIEVRVGEGETKTVVRPTPETLLHGEEPREFEIALYETEWEAANEHAESIEAGRDTPNSGEGDKDEVKLGNDEKSNPPSADSDSESIVSVDEDADTWHDRFANIAGSDDNDFTIAPIEDVVVALPDGTNDNDILTLDEQLDALPSDGDVESDAARISMPSAEDNLAVYGFPMDEEQDSAGDLDIVTLEQALPDAGVDADVETGGDAGLTTPADFGLDVGAESDPAIVGFEDYLAGETPGFLDHPDLSAEADSHDEPIFGAPAWAQPESTGVDEKKVAAAGASGLIGSAGAMA
ncbi:MAG: hypothetical protein FKY71_13525, partial [Spiribacter salinus]